jgi:solute carrier family 23 (nucleobase transporter), member 1
LATVIQATVGSRLPIVQGVSFAFLAVFFSIIAYGKENGLSAAEMMQLIAGSIIVGSMMEMVIGFTGLIGYLRKFLSPVVIGPVIMLIGLSLFQHGAPKAGTHWPMSGLTIVLVIVFSLVLAPRSRFFRIFPILSAIVIACVVAGGLSVTGFFGPGHPAHMSLATVESSPWLRVNPRELILPWGWPVFKVGFIVAAMAGFFASMIESFGDYHACSYMAGGGDPTSKQISRGIGCEGVGCLLTGVLGGFSSTSYSENIGLIGLTKVGSRYVVQVAGVILILLGLVAKFGAFAATIPGPVVGGLYCALFGLISAVGIQQLAKADLSSDRNLFIAGFSLFMGLSLPAYFDGTVTAYSPGAAELLDTLPQWLCGIIESIGKTGMAVAAIIGVVLDNVIPGSPQSRGLVDTVAATPQAPFIHEPNDVTN